MELINILIGIQEDYLDIVRYADTSGLRQVQFPKNVIPEKDLKHYYSNEEIFLFV